MSRTKDEQRQLMGKSAQKTMIPRPAVLQRCRSGDLNTDQGIRFQLGASNDVKPTRN